MKSEYFRLFENCIPVKGKTACMVCDIQRQNLFKIPLSYYDLLQATRHLTIDEIKGQYDSESFQSILSFFTFLSEKDLGHFTKFPESFPSLKLDWDSPSKITNAIITIGQYDFSLIFEQLDNLGCKAVEIRSFNLVTVQQLSDILCFSNQTRLKSVELILKYSNELEILLEKTDFLEKFPRVHSVKIHSAPENKDVLLENYTNVFYVKKELDFDFHCGIVNMELFALNIEFFTESQHHNTCLNRKISIDEFGNIKNCPSMKESFGNVMNTTLKEAIEKNGFKKYWNIHKDKIHVCKDCEFRYVCADCRAYVEDPEDIFSKPLKCGYNPYTGKWSEWSDNPLKKNAIKYYGMLDLFD